MEKKQNKSLTNFIDFKRYTLIIPAILLAIALFVFAIWGVNTSNDFKDSHTYNIQFNTTVSSKDFKSYQDIIVDTFEKESNGDFVVKVSRINDDIASGCKVNVYNNSELNDEAVVEKIESINEIIETKLNQLENARTVRVTVVYHQAPQSFGKNLVNGLIALLVIAGLVFVYNLFRFELKTALASIIVIPYSVINMLSIMVIFRIPFMANFMLPVLFSVILGYIMFTLLFDNIRQNLENKENYQTNDALVYGAIKANSTTLIALISAISLVLVLLTFVLNVATLYMCITLLFAVVVAVYSAVILPSTLWAMIYNKQNDNKLKARIRILEAREEKKKSKITKKDDNSATIA